MKEICGGRAKRTPSGSCCARRKEVKKLPQKVVGGEDQGALAQTTEQPSNKPMSTYGQTARRKIKSENQGVEPARLTTPPADRAREVAKSGRSQK